MRKGLVAPDRFTAMFGVIGLAEAVDLLQEREGRHRHATGTTPTPTRLALTITETRRPPGRRPAAAVLREQRRPRVAAQPGRPRLRRRASPRAPGSRSATSRRCSSTCCSVAPQHRWFPSGVSDVLAFDETAVRNPRRGRRRHPRRVRGGDAGRHVQPRQQRLRPHHRLPGAQVRPGQAPRSRAPGTAAPSWARARSHGPTSMQRTVKRVISGESALGLLADIVPFSWVDGPGNRYVVFLQGCNFGCIACHNPHTIPLGDRARQGDHGARGARRRPPGRALPVRRHGLRR